MSHTPSNSISSAPSRPLPPPSENKFSNEDHQYGNDGHNHKKKNSSSGQKHNGDDNSHDNDNEIDDVESVSSIDNSVDENKVPTSDPSLPLSLLIDLCHSNDSKQNHRAAIGFFSLSKKVSLRVDFFSHEEVIESMLTLLGHKVSQTVNVTAEAFQMLSTDKQLRIPLIAGGVVDVLCHLLENSITQSSAASLSIGMKSSATQTLTAKGRSCLMVTLSNLSTVSESHSEFCVYTNILLSLFDSPEKFTQRHSSLIIRNLSSNPTTWGPLVDNGLIHSLYSVITDMNAEMETKLNCMAILQSLSLGESYRLLIVSNGFIGELLKILYTPPSTHMATLIQEAAATISNISADQNLHHAINHVEIIKIVSNLLNPNLTLKSYPNPSPYYHHTQSPNNPTQNSNLSSFITPDTKFYTLCYLSQLSSNASNHGALFESCSHTYVFNYFFSDDIELSITALRYCSNLCVSPAAKEIFIGEMKVFSLLTKILSNKTSDTICIIFASLTIAILTEREDDKTITAGGGSPYAHLPSSSTLMQVDDELIDALLFCLFFPPSPSSSSSSPSDHLNPTEVSRYASLAIANISSHRHNAIRLLRALRTLDEKLWVDVLNRYHQDRQILHYVTLTLANVAIPLTINEQRELGLAEEQKDKSALPPEANPSQYVFGIDLISFQRVFRLLCSRLVDISDEFSKSSGGAMEFRKGQIKTDKEIKPQGNDNWNGNTNNKGNKGNPSNNNHHPNGLQINIVNESQSSGALSLHEDSLSLSRRSAIGHTLAVSSSHLHSASPANDFYSLPSPSELAVQIGRSILFFVYNLSLRPQYKSRLLQIFCAPLIKISLTIENEFDQLLVIHLISSLVSSSTSSSSSSSSSLSSLQLSVISQYGSDFLSIFRALSDSPSFDVRYANLSFVVTLVRIDAFTQIWQENPNEILSFFVLNLGASEPKIQSKSLEGIAILCHFDDDNFILKFSKFQFGVIFSMMNSNDIDVRIASWELLGTVSARIHKIDKMRKFTQNAQSNVNKNKNSNILTQSRRRSQTKQEGKDMKSPDTDHQLSPNVSSHSHQRQMPIGGLIDPFDDSDGPLSMVVDISKWDFLRTFLHLCSSLFPSDSLSSSTMEMSSTTMLAVGDLSSLSSLGGELTSLLFCLSNVLWTPRNGHVAIHCGFILIDSLCSLIDRANDQKVRLLALQALHNMAATTYAHCFWKGNTNVSGHGKKLLSPIVISSSLDSHSPLLSALGNFYRFLFHLLSVDPSFNVKMYALSIIRSLSTQWDAITHFITTEDVNTVADVLFFTQNKKETLIMKMKEREKEREMEKEKDNEKEKRDKEKEREQEGNPQSSRLLDDDEVPSSPSSSQFQHISDVNELETLSSLFDDSFHILLNLSFHFGNNHCLWLCGTLISQGFSILMDNQFDLSVHLHASDIIIHCVHSQGFYAQYDNTHPILSEVMTKLIRMSIKPKEFPFGKEVSDVISSSLPSCLLSAFGRNHVIKRILLDPNDLFDEFLNVLFLLLVGGGNDEVSDQSLSLDYMVTALRVYEILMMSEYQNMSRIGTIHSPNSLESSKLFSTHTVIQYLSIINDIIRWKTQIEEDEKGRREEESSSLSFILLESRGPTLQTICLRTFCVLMKVNPPSPHVILTSCYTLITHLFSLHQHISQNPNEKTDNSPMSKDEFDVHVILIWEHLVSSIDISPSSPSLSPSPSSFSRDSHVSYSSVMKFISSFPLDKFFHFLMSKNHFVRFSTMKIIFLLAKREEFADKLFHPKMINQVGNIVKECRERIVIEDKIKDKENKSDGISVISLGILSAQLISLFCSMAKGFSRTAHSHTVGTFGLDSKYKENDDYGSDVRHTPLSSSSLSSSSTPSPSPSSFPFPLEDILDLFSFSLESFHFLVSLRTSISLWNYICRKSHQQSSISLLKFFILLFRHVEISSFHVSSTTPNPREIYISEGKSIQLSLRNSKTFFSNLSIYFQFCVDEMTGGNPKKMPFNTMNIRGEILPIGSLINTILSCPTSEFPFSLDFISHFVANLHSAIHFILKKSSKEMRRKKKTPKETHPLSMSNEFLKVFCPLMDCLISVAHALLTLPTSLSQIPNFAPLMSATISCLLSSLQIDSHGQRQSRHSSSHSEIQGKFHLRIVSSLSLMVKLITLKDLDLPSHFIHHLSSHCETLRTFRLLFRSVGKAVRSTGCLRFSQWKIFYFSLISLGILFKFNKTFRRKFQIQRDKMNNQNASEKQEMGNYIVPTITADHQNTLHQLVSHDGFATLIALIATWKEILTQFPRNEMLKKEENQRDFLHSMKISAFILHTLTTIQSIQFILYDGTTTRVVMDMLDIVADFIKSPLFVPSFPSFAPIVSLTFSSAFHLVRILSLSLANFMETKNHQSIFHQQSLVSLAPLSSPWNNKFNILNIMESIASIPTDSVPLSTPLPPLSLLFVDCLLVFSLSVRFPPNIGKTFPLFPLKEILSHCDSLMQNDPFSPSVHHILSSLSIAFRSLSSNLALCPPLSHTDFPFCPFVFSTFRLISMQISHFFLLDSHISLEKESSMLRNFFRTGKIIIEILQYSHSEAMEILEGKQTNGKSDDSTALAELPSSSSNTHPIPLPSPSPSSFSLSTDLDSLFPHHLSFDFWHSLFFLFKNLFRFSPFSVQSAKILFGITLEITSFALKFSPKLGENIVQWESKLHKENGNNLFTEIFHIIPTSSYSSASPSPSSPPLFSLFEMSLCVLCNFIQICPRTFLPFSSLGSLEFAVEYFLRDFTLNTPHTLTHAGRVALFIFISFYSHGNVPMLFGTPNDSPRVLNLQKNFLEISLKGMKIPGGIIKSEMVTINTKTKGNLIPISLKFAENTESSLSLSHCPTMLSLPASYSPICFPIVPSTVKHFIFAISSFRLSSLINLFLIMTKDNLYFGDEILRDKNVLISLLNTDSPLLSLLSSPIPWEFHLSNVILYILCIKCRGEQRRQWHSAALLAIYQKNIDRLSESLGLSPSPSPFPVIPIDHLDFSLFLNFLSFCDFQSIEFHQNILKPKLWDVLQRIHEGNGSGRGNSNADGEKIFSPQIGDFCLRFIYFSPKHLTKNQKFPLINMLMEINGKGNEKEISDPFHLLILILLDIGGEMDTGIRPIGDNETKTKQRGEEDNGSASHSLSVVQISPSPPRDFPSPPYDSPFSLQQQRISFHLCEIVHMNFSRQNHSQSTLHSLESNVITAAIHCMALIGHSNPREIFTEIQKNYFILQIIRFIQNVHKEKQKQQTLKEERKRFQEGKEGERNEHFRDILMKKISELFPSQPLDPKNFPSKTSELSSLSSFSSDTKGIEEQKESITHPPIHTHTPTVHIFDSLCRQFINRWSFHSDLYSLLLSLLSISLQNEIFTKGFGVFGVLFFLTEIPFHMVINALCDSSRSLLFSFLSLPFMLREIPYKIKIFADSENLNDFVENKHESFPTFLLGIPHSQITKKLFIAAIIMFAQIITQEKGNNTKTKTKLEDHALDHDQDESLDHDDDDDDDDDTSHGDSPPPPLPPPSALILSFSYSIECLIDLLQNFSKFQRKIQGKKMNNLSVEREREREFASLVQIVSLAIRVESNALMVAAIEALETVITHGTITDTDTSLTLLISSLSSPHFPFNILHREAFLGHLHPIVTFCLSKCTAEDQSEYFLPLHSLLSQCTKMIQIHKKQKEQITNGNINFHSNPHVKLGKTKTLQ